MHRSPLTLNRRVWMSKWAIGLAVVLCLSAGVIAQERPQRPPEFVSPEVLKDGSLVVRIFAPQAKSVRLSSSDLPGSNPFAPGNELKKGENGVWELTVPTVAPGSYRYCLNVDGVSVVDSRNTSTSESNSTTWSLVSIPGSPVSDLADVPHGAVAQVQYRSKSLDRFRRAHVYTPPGYETSSETLPVLYLLHGASDCDASWSSVGRAGLVLDNLIAAGKAKPMIVVMPMGHTGPFSFGGGGSSSFQDQMLEFQKDFEQDLKPFVESRYRISKERKHHAIAGLSMGGAQTLDIAISNLKDFGYVGVFSSGVFGIAGGGPPGASNGPSWEEKHREVLDSADLKKDLRLVWFATGKEDFLLTTTQATVKALKSHGFEVTYDETDGGHTWIKWREAYLPEFASKLFQD